MKVLVTGSSGQIGTNLALRLQADGHEVFGVDKRQNTWTDEFPYLLQDLAGHYARVPRGDQRRRVPGGRPRRPPRGAREGAPARPAAAPGARERRHDVQRARVRATPERPDRVLVEPRGVRRRASFRGVRRAGRRLRLRGEHVLGVEDLRRGVRLLLRALLRASAISCSASRTSTAGSTTTSHRMVRVIPLFIHSMLRGEPITIYGGNDKTLDFTYVDDCIDGIVAGIEALGERRVVNQTINLAYGQGNTLVRCAELIAGELGSAPDMTLAPSLLGEVTHYVADLSKARGLLGYEPEGVPGRGHRACRRVVQGAPGRTSGGGRSRSRRSRGDVTRDRSGLEDRRVDASRTPSASSSARIGTELLDVLRAARSPSARASSALGRRGPDSCERRATSSTSTPGAEAGVSRRSRSASRSRRRRL